MMEKLLQNLLTADLHGSIVILAVLLLRAVLRKTPKKYICFLWMLAGLRLLLPVPLVSSLSLQPLSLNMPSFGTDHSELQPDFLPETQSPGG